MVANDKKSFVLYNSYETQFKLLSMEERGMLITAIFEYANFQSLNAELPPLVNMAFSFVKETLDRDRENYLEKCEKNTENGKKGGRPKKNISMPKTERFFEKPKKADNDIDNDIDNVIDIDSDSGSGSGIENEIENDIDIGNGIEDIEKRPADEVAPISPCVSDGSAPRLSETEKRELIKKGLSEGYIREREERAAAYSAGKGRSISDTLERWWREDKASHREGGANARQRESPSYDIDEFYQAAVEYSQRMMCEELGLNE